MIREAVEDERVATSCAFSGACDLNAADPRVFAEISNLELGRAGKLHDLVTDAISETRRSRREVPAGMGRIWGFEHDRIVEEEAAVRNLLMVMNG